eukprot:jgi/Mesvir1/14763/Mv05404-RA.1
MLDHFAIFTRGGMILWSISYAELKGSPIEALIRACLIEERSGETSFPYTQDATSYNLKWTFHNELGLVFVVVFQRMLQLLYVDDLLEAVKKEFSGRYRENTFDYKDFDDVFRQLHQEAEARAEEAKRPGKIVQAEPVKKQKQRVENKTKTGPSGKSGKSGKGGSDDEADTKESETTANSATDTAEVVKSGEVTGGFDISKLKQRSGKGSKKTPDSKPKEAEPPKKPKKQMRNWNDPTPEQLDFTDKADREAGKECNAAPVDVSVLGKSHMDEAEQDLDDDLSSDEDDDVDDQASGSGASGRANGKAANGKAAVSATPAKRGWFSSVFKQVVGSSELERADLDPALMALKEQLMAKNVAEAIAEKLCESVAASLLGKKQASFTRVSSTVRHAMADALTRILTPKRSTDMLAAVLAAKNRGRPYTVVFCGVNGVGKSTNLAKIAYWLLQHNLKVMIAACDTFRAGAVEQLRTHCTRLQVTLYERGYEKDPANVARDAISAAAREGCDVVLVDTAGRMQDNEPLMRSLSKLINMNSPDLVLFVGEALVGNDAVDQLTKFNERLADLSTGAHPRLIDGIVLTKFDTIDDKVGAALSMAYTSGSPIMFVGCGQDYPDLRKLSIKSVIKSLLS